MFSPKLSGDHFLEFWSPEKSIWVNIVLPKKQDIQKSHATKKHFMNGFMSGKLFVP